MTAKIFVIGLPRTGTTSVSVALLEQGFSVAHQAFTQQSFHLADVVSDAPCFSDYQQLDLLFPNTKFIYLTRPLEKWVISMQMLLAKMLPQLAPHSGKFHPILKRSFENCFQVSTVENPLCKQHLTNCFLRHQQQVQAYFANRTDFLQVNLHEPNSLTEILDFLGCSQQQSLNMPHLNIGTHVASWDEYSHPNKISSHAFGPNRRKFFDYNLPTPS
ncbi:sulfotransferase [Shewanella intestini]|uniref:Sulfotransferase family protein n=1 Tax=Shewanella intestini TaxID=2017544 RepID=A0ABS5I4E9_9GAMM|nr:MULTISPECIES: sulfotransferase [Shewanella]MBR9728703.1 sulfotransferase family protein [Shewanella intestini]MRG37626.1 sulfotransferase family protein [Shewanella sp. XMDDZSB0408]